jgi:hypothetical protein
MAGWDEGRVAARAGGLVLSDSGPQQTHLAERLDVVRQPLFYCSSCGGSAESRAPDRTRRLGEVTSQTCVPLPDARASGISNRASAETWTWGEFAGAATSKTSPALNFSCLGPSSLTTSVDSRPSSMRVIVTLASPPGVISTEIDG